MEIDLKPTEGMAREAQRGLDWRKDGFDGGTPVGLARARQLVNRQNLSPSTVKRMHSFFSRHEVDKQGEGFYPGPGYPSNGRVAWALWGGDAGQTWARAKAAALDKSMDDYGAECPTVTHNDELNLANHLAAIEEAGLGPANPDAPENEFWAEKAAEWNISEAEARNRQCQNCEYYKNTPKMLECLRSSTMKASDLPVEPKWADVGTVSGYCTEFDITCTATRTCSEWEPQEFVQEEEEKIMNKVFKLDSTIKSVEDTSTELKIEGYASTDALDRASDKILPSAWTKGGLNNFKNNPILLFNHNYSEPIGRVTEITTDSKGLKIKGVISKSAGRVYDLVKERILTTFSVGFKIIDADYNKSNDGLIIKDAELLEVSVVTIPCNQDAIFSIAKSFENSEDYEKYKSVFINNEVKTSQAGNTQSGVKTPMEKTKMDNDIAALVEKTARETAEKMAAVAAERAAADKAAADAATAKAAEEAANAEKISVAVASGLNTGAERLIAEIESKMASKEADISSIIDEKMAALKEASEDLIKMRDSKRVFGDRRGNGDWKSEKGLYNQVEDAFILGLATKKGWNTKFASEVIEKVNQHSGVVVSSADFEQEVSSNIERDIQLQLVLAPLFREISLRSATQIIPIMPDAGYAEITSNATSSGSAPAGNLDARGSAYGAPYGGVTLNEVVLSTVKLISQSYLGNETEEDAIIPILPLIRESIVRSHARGVENAMLLGNHVDGVYTSGAFNGLIKTASTGSRNLQSATAFASESLTGLQLLNARKNLGKWGVDPRDVIYIVSLTEYYNLLKDTAFQDWNQVQNDAVKMTGEVGSIYGSRVIVCDEFATPAVSKHYGLAVNTRNFVVPRLRGMTMENDYQARNQNTAVIATQRIGFTELIAGATAVTSLQYKAT
jgi:HK97 family phage prohead protease